METIEIKNRLIEATKFAVDLCNEVLGRDFSYPKIDFDIRGTCGGKAWWFENRVSYNLGIAAENISQFETEICIHEIAHVIAGRLYGRGCGHGPLWKNLMLRLGQKPSRCHNFDVEKHRVRHVRKFSYVCKCDTHEVSSTIHNRITRGRYYNCRKCKCRLTLVPSSGIVENNKG